MVVQIILIVALILLLIVSVACGVYAVVMLKRALDAEKQAQRSSDEAVEVSTGTAQHADVSSAHDRALIEEPWKQLRTALKDIENVQATGNQAIRDADRSVQQATQRGAEIEAA